MTVSRSIPVVDLFAGPGGLGEGFSGEISGEHPFRIAISVEKDPVAHRTLTLRAFVRIFTRHDRQIPEEYYGYLAGKISRQVLEEKYPAEWKAAYKEALCAELGNPKSGHQPEIDKRIGEALRGSRDWVLIGGPPCQAYSLVGRSRMLGALKDKSGKLVDGGKAFFKDHRHKLYRQYLRIIALHGPAVFVMENVKGILSSKLDEKKIFPQILEDLRNPSAAAKQYDWANAKQCKYRIVSFVTGKEPRAGRENEFLIRAEKHGIPQARHRVILLGIREDVFDKIDGRISPLASETGPNIDSIIYMMPRLRSGFSKGPDSVGRWRAYFKHLGSESWVKDLDPEIQADLKNALTVLGKEELCRKYIGGGRFPVEKMDGWYADEQLNVLPNHSTRAHMDSDLARYLFVATYGMTEGRSPHLVDFPAELRPNHKNIQNDDDPEDQKFSDRFKVQLWDGPASTITSHISKDGHYFIHPDPTQCRSLTVREAARLQTFPDNYFFEGGRTKQYHQVGNAVPPYLAKQLAEVVWDILQRACTTK